MTNQPPNNQFPGGPYYQGGQGQPLQQPPQPMQGDNGKRKLPMIIAMIVVVALVAGGFYFAYTKLQQSQNLAQMEYLEFEEQGVDPFMESVANIEASEAVGDSGFGRTDKSAGSPGSDPNLYGGSSQLSVCDVARLVENLDGDAQLKRAFAEGIGIASDDVSVYVNSLNPMVLMQDTWVTNHGYKDGHATPFQAVLQRGTGVLVDAKGVPRVRCSCGNPLAEAWTGYTAPSRTGAAWEGFSPSHVTAIYESQEWQNELRVYDLDEGQAISLENDAEDIENQKSVMDNVTDSTPRTVPSDMGTNPDKELLESIGMPAAKDDDERPDDSSRFQTNNGTFDPEAQPREHTEAVDPGSFETGPGIYFVRMEGTDGVRGWCLVKGAENADAGVSCGGDDLNVELKQVNYGAGATIVENINAITFDKDLKSFKPNVSMAGTPGGGAGPTPDPMKRGQHVVLGDFVCYNFSDSFACEGRGSDFRATDDKQVFINSSDQPLGTVCSSLDFGGVGERNLLVSSGAVNCAEAKGVAEVFSDAWMNGETDGMGMYFEHNDWKCHRADGAASADLGRTAECAQQSAPHGSFIVTTESGTKPLKERAKGKSKTKKRTSKGDAASASSGGTIDMKDAKSKMCSMEVPNYWKNKSVSNSDTLQLQDGKAYFGSGKIDGWAQWAVPFGTASEADIETDMLAYNRDFDGDGQEEIVAMLTDIPYGTMKPSPMVLMLDKDLEITDELSYSLIKDNLSTDDSRNFIKDLSVEGDNIVITMNVFEDSDPNCCASKEATMKFKWSKRSGFEIVGEAEIRSQ